MPYKTSAYSIVFFLWVITINCVLFLNSFKNFPKLSTFTSSSAASTSSKMQNGTGLVSNIANKSDIAVNVFSPPDKSEICLSVFPGGSAFISIPVVKTSSGLVNLSSASPPENNFLNTSLNLTLITSKVSKNFSFIIPSNSFIISKIVSSAFSKSDFCAVKNSYLFETLSYSSIAPTFTSPNFLISALHLSTISLASLGSISRK